MTRLSLLACLSVCAFGAPPQPPSLRLGDNVQPTHYAVVLKLAPPEEGFSGTVDIDVKIAQPTSVIWMNGQGLTPGHAVVHFQGHALGARVLVEPDGFLGLELKQPVGPGTAAIHIPYQGKLSKTSSDGLFLNREGGDWYVFSQFEPISARRAFPCFDEPGFKTPWQLTLEVPKGDRAFSNTPQVSAKEHGETTVVTFAESKPLPSYLVALAVGPIDVVDAGTAGRNHVPVRILVPHGRQADAQFAAKVTPEIVNRLEAYFGIPYPYAKLDSVALPLIYGFGAMENAGLVTYAQNLILASPASQTTSFEREYVEVAMHELAHQWFGDLVTLAWWNDTWLNEAFATWTEQKLVGEWKPTWDEAVADVLDTERAMEDDSLVSARAVRQPIKSDNDIANAFDLITYNKGAAVIRMFEQWVGPEAFQKGVRLYLTRHAWGNANADEFLADVSEGAGKNIKEAFSTFLDQPGVPLVSVTLQCGAGAPALEVSQKRYLPLGSPGSQGEMWQIPVCARTEGGRRCMLLAGARGRLELPGQACPAWVDGNAGELGYYRVDYYGGLLAKALQDSGKQLLPAERAGVLGDAQALVRGGELPGAQGLKMAAEFASDPNWRVETSAADLAESFAAHLVPDAERPNYERYIRDAFGAHARRLGWVPKAGESDDDRLLRPKLVGLVARQGEDRTLAGEAQRLAREWLKDHAAVKGEAAGAVLNTAAEFGDAALFDEFLNAAKAEKSSRDRRRLIAALGSFRDPALARRALGLTLSPDFDARETIGLLFLPLEYEATRVLPFEFVKQHFDELVARLPRGAGSDAGARLPEVGKAFCSPQRREEVQAFFASRIRQFIGGPRDLAKTLESVQVCSAVAQAQEPGVGEFLKQSVQQSAISR